MSDAAKPSPESSTKMLKELLKRIVSLFHLWDQTDKAGTIDTITENIEFRDASVWSLIIAIILASIGLNTNSPALIIGAMLISPLMGPIMGAGMALGIYDVPLLRRSLMNLAIMTGISLAVSFIYFALSPLRGTTHELMIRTVPTFFDVLVALFGGTAMIIAVSRKSRSTNTIAGVAVATALMPPLCTAGFGLANGNMGIFAGAAYLYLINSVFIGLTTFFFTKYLKLKAKSKAGQVKLGRKQIVLFAVLAVVFITPSVFMAYDVIQETSFQSKVDHFVALNLRFPESQISNIQKHRGAPRSNIVVTMVGSPISDEMIKHLNAQLPEFGLADTDLKVIQNSAFASNVSLPFMPDASVKAMPGPSPSAYPEPTPQKPAVMAATSATPNPAESGETIDRTLLLEEVSHEVNVLFPNIESFSWGDLLVTTNEQISPVKTYTVLVKWKDGVKHQVDQATLAVFLKLRLKSENLSVLNL